MMAASVKARVGAAPLKMLADAAPNLRQRFGKPREPARFARFAHALPIGMIAVLQAPGGIAPDGLDVRARIGSIEHVRIGRRDGKRSEALCLGGADRFALGGQIAKAAAAPLALQGQIRCRDVSEAKLL